MPDDFFAHYKLLDKRLSELERDYDSFESSFRELASQFETANNELRKVQILMTGDDIYGLKGVSHRLALLEEAIYEVKQKNSHNEVTLILVVLILVVVIAILVQLWK